MPTILDTIVAETERLVAARKRSVAVSQLETLPGYLREPVPFAEALRGRQLAIIAESKKASPSQGLIRIDYDAASNAVAYQEAGARAISVLTEPAFFKGSLDDLQAVRSSVDVPILRKDFIVDPYQMVEARAFGADAALLIATILDRARLGDLLDAADAVGLECLVECYDAGELDRIDLDRVRVIGVNNRDLNTFAVDRSHAPRVLANVPDRIVRVAESGLRTADDLATVWDAGIDAVLIGEAFMRAEDPGAALATLRQETELLLYDAAKRRGRS